MDFIDISVLISAIGVLTILTNLIVEVEKKVLRNVPANLIAVAVAMVLTMVAFFAYTDTLSIDILWYHYAAAVVVGFLVAYAAMFGFDKLKETLLRLKEQK